MNEVNRDTVSIRIEKSKKDITAFDVAKELIKSSGRLKTLNQLENLEKDYDMIIFRSYIVDTEVFYSEDKSIIVNTCVYELDAWKNAILNIKNLFSPKSIDITTNYLWDFSGAFKKKEVLELPSWEEPVIA